MLTLQHSNPLFFLSQTQKWYESPNKVVLILILIGVGCLIIYYMFK